MGEPTIETLARRQERDEREIEGKRSGEGERRVNYQRKKAKGYPLCRGPFAFFSLT